MVYTSSGRQTGWYIFGGTSAGAPTFSGVVALLNHHLTAYGFQSSSGLGNVNPRSYSFAAATPSAFHDVATGNNVVTACTGFRCTSADTQSVGYDATAGYDRVTGLGSVDGYPFVTGWHVAALLPKSSSTVSLSAAPATLTADGSTTLTAVVTGTGGATPTGAVTFSVGGANLGAATLAGSAPVSTATVQTGELAASRRNSGR